MKRLLAYIFLLLLPFAGRAQTVYQQVSSKLIYAFVDEMANERIIEVNSTVNSYSREFIARCLDQVKKSEARLTIQQKKDLDFYLREYRSSQQSPHIVFLPLSNTISALIAALLMCSVSLEYRYSTKLP